MIPTENVRKHYQAPFPIFRAEPGDKAIRSVYWRFSLVGALRWGQWTPSVLLCGLCSPGLCYTKVCWDSSRQVSVICKEGRMMSVVPGCTQDVLTKLTGWKVDTLRILISSMLWPAMDDVISCQIQCTLSKPHTSETALHTCVSIYKLVCGRIQ